MPKYDIMTMWQFVGSIKVQCEVTEYCQFFAAKIKTLPKAEEFIK